LKTTSQICGTKQDGKMKSSTRNMNSTYGKGNKFFIQFQIRFTAKTRKSSPSLSHLIIENKDSADDSLLIQEMQVKNRSSGKEPHPSRILFIGPSKRIKD
jgi:hypothetical protein